ncbi:hypothetical protein LZ198_19825 [Myxococcus sp. K15C18031901]|uniref:hypothetical protein n=1 Tax=Myxococcus dinghuensis TaxID=2906761 RepID=UPI0020A71438|nr:hypothetical protein [Myxococcus dinghuensis]MCP3101128.1 hypothetical protein [Myxococcus dinghuensis]
MAYSVIAGHVERIIKAVLALSVLGGVGALLYVGITRVQLPVALAVLVGGVTLVATLLMLLLPGRR